MSRRLPPPGARLSAVLVVAVLGLGALCGGLWCYWRTPLPTYSLLLEGGQATYLQGEATITLRPETRLSLTLRPATSVTRPVFVHARLQQAGRESLWPVLFEQTSRGTIRLQGTAQELIPTCTGRCVLRLYIYGAYLPSAWLALCPNMAMKLLPSIQELRAEVIFTRS